MQRFEKEFDQLKLALINQDEQALKTMFEKSSQRREKLEK